MKHVFTLIVLALFSVTAFGQSKKAEMATSKTVYTKKVKTEKTEVSEKSVEAIKARALKAKRAEGLQPATNKKAVRTNTTVKTESKKD